jgi:N-acetylglucosaminyldiphosphoundecaprenol N-acetyl-beta-D-mannosaminyltransferase
MKTVEGSEKTFRVLTSELRETDSERLIRHLENRALRAGPAAVGFSDTEFVTLRQREFPFADLTNCFDLLVAGSWPLIWAMKRLGSVMKEPIEPADFMRRILNQSTPDFRHYFIGASEECNNRLRERILKQNPDIEVVGFFHGKCSPAGYLQPPELHDSILEELREKEPHFVWVGLGTRKEYALVANLKRQLHSGILLPVGSAFEVNAGMRAHAPLARRLFGANLKDSVLFFARILRGAL